MTSSEYQGSRRSKFHFVVGLCVLIFGAQNLYAEAAIGDQGNALEQTQRQDEVRFDANPIATGHYRIDSDLYPIRAFQFSVWANELMYSSNIRYRVYYRDQFGNIVLGAKYAALHGEVYQIAENTWEMESSYTTVGLEICTLPIRLTFIQEGDGYFLKIYQPLKVTYGCVIESFQTVRVDQLYLPLP